MFGNLKLGKTMNEKLLSLCKYSQTPPQMKFLLGLAGICYKTNSLM